MNRFFLLLICFSFAFQFEDFDSTKVKNPKIAVMLSIIPGGGQIYNEKYMKSILFLSAEYIFINNIRANERSGNLSSSYIEKRNSGMWWIFGIYVLNLIDAYVDAHLSSFPNKKKYKIEKNK